MAEIVTNPISISSGGYLTDGGIGPVEDGTFYSMSTTNWTDGAGWRRPVGKYDTVSITHPRSEINNKDNMQVFSAHSVASDPGWIYDTDLSNAFLTIVNSGRGNPTTPTVLITGIGKGLKESDTDSFRSKSMPNISNLIESAGIIAGATDSLSNLGLNRKKENYSGLNNQAISNSLFLNNEPRQVMYSRFNIGFERANNAYSDKSGQGKSILELNFYQAIPIEIVVELVKMLDINNPDNSIFGSLDHKEFKDSYLNFLNSVGRLLKQSIPHAIADSIRETLNDNNSYGPYEFKLPTFVEVLGADVKSFIFNPKNKSQADDIREVNELFRRNVITFTTKDIYLKAIAQEKVILKTILGGLAGEGGDLLHVIRGDGTATAEGAGSTFGDFAQAYIAVMEGLWNGIRKDPTRNKPRGSVKDGDKVVDRPGLNLDRNIANQDEAVAAILAGNQVLEITVGDSNLNFFQEKATRDFNQASSVLDIIRDEAQYPKSDNVVNVEEAVSEEDKDRCEEYFKKLDIQKQLRILKSLKIQLCSNLDKMSDTMMKLKRLQLSNDFKIASLFSGFKGISFSEFGLPAGNIKIPDFSLPNFGKPGLNLSDFGIPNIGLDLSTNLEIPNITIPQIDLPDVNIPGIGGISTPKLQSWNFNWDSPAKSLSDAKKSLSKLNETKVYSNVKFPKGNWDPDLNLSALTTFSSQLTCEGDPSEASPKIEVTPDDSCKLISDIKKIVDKPAEGISKVEMAQKESISVLKKYESYIDSLNGDMLENADIAKKMAQIQGYIVAQQNEIQSQASGQVATSTNSVKDGLGNALNNVPDSNGEITRTKSSLTKITTNSTDAAISTLRV